MIFSVKEIRPNELLITHDAWYGFMWFWVIVAAVIVLGFVLTSRDNFGSCVTPLFVVGSLYAIWGTREFTTVINQNSQTLHYQKSGILGSRLDAVTAEYNISDVQALEIRRYTTRGADSFKLCLMIGQANGIEKELYISKSLGYLPAHQYAEQIHNFLGQAIPLKKMDGSWFGL